MCQLHQLGRQKLANPISANRDILSPPDYCSFSCISCIFRGWNAGNQVKLAADQVIGEAQFQPFFHFDARV
jgi:hypothetical protein